MWEQFRGLALPLLGQHFPPELIKDNGDSIVFTSRRDDAPLTGSTPSPTPTPRTWPAAQAEPPTFSPKSEKFPQKQLPYF